MEFKKMMSVLIRLFLLFCISHQCQGEENIASIQEPDLKIKNDTGNYELAILAAATLTNITVNGFKISELSGLAWDNDENILYALSDNGYILHLRPVFSNDHLKEILFIAGYFLRDQNNRPLRYKASDSEGLTASHTDNHIRGDTQLIVSFERIPRIIRYSTSGDLLSEITLPDVLTDINNYQSENKSLEAVTFNEKFGIITGPEFALKNQDSTQMNIYSASGKSWHFPLHDQYHGGLVDMTIMEDGSTLALERSYGGLFPALQISLHRLNLDETNSSSEIICNFPADEKIFNNNFEGITRFRKNRYFMISDDNNHPFNRTMLLYFSITNSSNKN